MYVCRLLMAIVQSIALSTRHTHTHHNRGVCFIVEKLASNKSCARYIKYYYYFCIVIDFKCVCVYLADGKKLLTGQLRRTELQFPHTIYLNAQCSDGGGGRKSSSYKYILCIIIIIQVVYLYAYIYIYILLYNITYCTYII